MSWIKDLHRQRNLSSSPQHPPAPSSTPRAPTSANKTLLQTFEWHTPSTPPPPNETHSPTSHYARLLRALPSLAEWGVTALWLPPGCKANNPKGNGYDCYDLWDLGEFDQKWARSTKWGGREELRDLIEQARGGHGLEIVWDAVLNHKTAGDGTEECWAVEVDGRDRRIETCPPKKIESWLRYDFPGRGDAYSALRWRAEHFNGTDWDQRTNRHAIFKLIDDPAGLPRPEKEDVGPAAGDGTSGRNRLLRFAGKPAPVPPRRPGKGWADDVDGTYGNHDYLMFSNIDYTHPAVREDVLKWGEWMVESTGLDGFRLDAAQHYSWGFTREWIGRVHAASRRKTDRDAFIVGEVWTGDVGRILRWLDAVGQGTRAYDAPLLYNFSRIASEVARGSRAVDLRTIIRGSLLECRPHSAVTIVTNHDTQPGQTSYTPMDPRLKPLFYAFILLRKEGYPCVFWGDLFGTAGPHAEPPACTSPDGKRSLLVELMLARQSFAYGEQRDYFDAPGCVAWSRAGTHDRRGCVVMLSVLPAGKTASKRIGLGRPGDTWVDILSLDQERPTVVSDKNGFGTFSCRGVSVAVFVQEDAEGLGRFPVKFDAALAQ